MCIHFFLQNHIYAILIQQPSLKIFTNRQNPQTNRNTKKMHTHTLAQILSETRRRRRAAPSEKPPFLAAVSRHTITHGLAFNLRSTIRSTYTRGHTRTPLAHNVRYNVRVHRRHRCRALRVGGGEVINRFYTRILAGRCRRRRRRRGDAIILRSRSVAWKLSPRQCHRQHHHRVESSRELCKRSEAEKNVRNNKPTKNGPRQFPYSSRIMVSATRLFIFLCRLVGV